MIICFRFRFVVLHYSEKKNIYCIIRKLWKINYKSYYPKFLKNDEIFKLKCSTFSFFQFQVIQLEPFSF